MTLLRRLTLCLLLSGLLAGYSTGEEIRSEPFQTSVVRYSGGPHFTRLSPQQTRIPYIHEIATWHPDQRLFTSAFSCGALLLGDVDLDGQMDLFVTGGPRPNALYLQAGNMSFVDLSSGMGLKGAEGWAAGAAMIDIDGDEDLDIYVCYYDRPNELYINKIKESGVLNFENEAEAYGLDIADASLVPAFCDYDRDGDLDLYLLTHQLIREGGRPDSAVQTEQIPGQQKARIVGDAARYYKLADKPDAEGRWLYDEVGRSDYLLRNDEGKFKVVTKTSGVSTEPAVGNSVIWWDYDEDGWPDLYVANDGGDQDYLYRNTKNGKFEDVTKSVLPRVPWFSCGATVTDANNDGHLDLLVGDRAPSTHYKKHLNMPSAQALQDRQRAEPRQIRRNALYLQSGTSSLMEVAQLWGLGETDWTWSIKAGDYDQDGFEDLFFTNGAARNFHNADLKEPTHEMMIGKTRWHLMEKNAKELEESNRAFRNLGDHYEDVSKEWGLGALSMSQTCAQGDLDGDGDLDLVVASLNEPITIYRNDGPKGDAIRVRLKGTKSNIDGVGAIVRVTSGDRVSVRQKYPSWGYMDADEPALHFGMGTARAVELLEVTWPSGNVQKFENLPTNFTYYIEESEAPTPKVLEPKPKTWFTKSDLLDSYEMPERRFNDYEAQALLPDQLSQFGPSQAWGDYDGDGDMDLFLGGGTGESGRLLLNKISNQGTQFFGESRQWAFDNDALSEDMGAVFFDADQDGDLDLYVVSGGVENEAGSDPLGDRLYQNRGERGLSPFPKEALPELKESGSVVCASDFDRDGDLDLFVGTRTEVGNYPSRVSSYILVNEGGTFKDASQDVAPDLEKLGMVTSALWCDVDDDGWQDLMIALDWGPIVLLRNENGFFEHEPISGSEKHLGRWNGLAAGDLDNDGDLDLVATNLGLNGPFSASANAPQLLFYGDMNGDEKKQIVQAVFENGVSYPYIGLERSSEAMPWIQAQIATNKKWASSSVPQIFGLDRLRQSLILKVTDQESGVFLNDGSGYFTFQPFPRLTQVAPAYGIGLADYNGDGYLDIYLAQNFSYPRQETGALTGGLGQLLRRNPDATEPSELYLEVPATESGIVMPEDARSVSAIDINQDKRPDLVIGRNGKAPQVYLNEKESQHVPITLKLKGPETNRRAIGSRVTFSVAGMPMQTIEVTTAGGFLTSPPTGPLVFYKPDWLLEVIFVEVRWPDGQQKSYTFPPDQTELTIEYPVPEPKPEVEALEATEAPEGAG